MALDGVASCDGYESVRFELARNGLGAVTRVEAAAYTVHRRRQGERPIECTATLELLDLGHARSMKVSTAAYRAAAGQLLYTSAMTPLMTSQRPITAAPITAAVRPRRAIQALKRSTLSLVLSGANTYPTSGSSRMICCIRQK